MLCWAIPSESKTRNRSDSVWTEKEQSDATAMPRLRANLARSHRQSGHGVGAGPNKRFSQKILTVATVELLAI